MWSRANFGYEATNRPLTGHWEPARSGAGTADQPDHDEHAGHQAEADEGVRVDLAPLGRLGSLGDQRRHKMGGFHPSHTPQTGNT